MNTPEPYVRLLEVPKTRLGTITAFRMENGHIEYLFHDDERLDNKLPDLWVLPSEVESCQRPTNSEVDAVNRLMKHGGDGSTQC
jgi:hypothetical protein